MIKLERTNTKYIHSKPLHLFEICSICFRTSHPKEKKKPFSFCHNLLFSIWPVLSILVLFFFLYFFCQVVISNYWLYCKIFCCRVVSLCMSPINDSFMSGSLDHSVRIWDLRVNACQVGFLFLMIIWKLWGECERSNQERLR